MDSVQVGKAVFVKVSFASLGFEPRTFSYPGNLLSMQTSNLGMQMTNLRYMQICFLLHQTAKPRHLWGFRYFQFGFQRCTMYI